MREGDPVAQGEATLALYYIAFGNPDSQLAIAQAGAIEPLVELLRNGAARSQQGAASLLGWLAFHDDNKVAYSNPSPNPNPDPNPDPNPNQAQLDEEIAAHRRLLQAMLADQAVEVT